MSITWYKVCQGVLCVLWFVFSIVSWGSFDGWMRISILNDYNKSATKFCIFLTILEALAYTASCILGIICILQINKVFPSAFYLNCRPPKRTSAIGSPCLPKYNDVP